MLSNDIYNHISQMEKETILKIKFLEKDWVIQDSDMIKKIKGAHKLFDKNNITTNKYEALIRLYVHVDTMTLIQIMSELENEEMLDDFFVFLNRKRTNDIFSDILYNRIMTLYKIKILPSLYSNESLDSIEQAIKKMKGV